MSQFPPESTDLPSQAPPIQPSSGGVPLWATLGIGLLCLGAGLAVSLMVATKKTEPVPIAPRDKRCRDQKAAAHGSRAG